MFHRAGGADAGLHCVLRFVVATVASSAWPALPFIIQNVNSESYDLGDFFELPHSIAPSIARSATLTLCIRPISNRISVPLTLHNYRLFICHISLTKVLKMICILQKSLSEELPLPHTYFCRQAVLVFNFVTGNCLFNMGTS